MAKTLTKHQKLDLLRSLRRAINTRPDRRPHWFEPRIGLCTNFEVLCYHQPIEIASRDASFKELFFNHVKTWPYFSGDKDYYIPAHPISQRSEGDAKAAYRRRDNMYDRRSPYCRLRHDLLDHVIACVEAESD